MRIQLHHKLIALGIVIRLAQIGVVCGLAYAVIRLAT